MLVEFKNTSYEWESKSKTDVVLWYVDVTETS